MPSIIINFLLWILLIPASFIAVNQYEYRHIKIARNPIIWVGAIFATLLIGLRWDNGGDYANYYSIITGPIQGNFELDRLEFFPRIFDIFIHYYNLPFYVWFVIMTFIQFVILILLSKKCYHIFPWVVILYFYCLFSLSLIITRQIIALLIVLYGFTFIKEKKLINYLVLVSLAYGFHRTALICLPFYWIFPRIKNNNIPLQIFIVICFIFSGEKLVNLLWSLVPIDSDSFRYSGYVGREYDYSVKSGLGMMVNYLRYMIIILYSNKLKEKYESVGFNTLYNILFIFICVYYAVRNDLPLSRAFMYFQIAELIITGYLFHYLLNSKKERDKGVFVALLSLILITVVYTAYNGAPWHFVWDRF